MRRFVLGDIHGAYKALVQCFERSAFNRETDLLIFLGDLCDGWPETKEVLEEFFTIRNLIWIMGNHDKWLIDWIRHGDAPHIWLSQGGSETIRSFTEGISERHLLMLSAAVPYFVMDKKLFVHGGIQTNIPVENQDENFLRWDRSLVNTALKNRLQGRIDNLTAYDMVFVGHTPTIIYHEGFPITACGVCMMDTGAGWPGGRLTMKDLDSNYDFQSDRVDLLYNAKGRNF